MQAEYATDIIFRSPADVEPLYARLSRTAIHTVKPDQVATFLGRKLTARYEGALGTHFTTRIEGTRIKHHMGPVSLKLYDKFGVILRLETTTSDVSFFKHDRTVEQRDGTKRFHLAPLKKTIYSLQPDLRQVMDAANQRYLAFLSDLEDPTAGTRALTKLTAAVQEHGRTYKGDNVFEPTDQRLFETLARGEFLISGLRTRDLQQHLGRSTAQISHALKRLRLHALIKRVGRTYTYDLTKFGQQVTLLGLKLKELYVIPALAQGASPSR